MVEGQELAVDSRGREYRKAGIYIMWVKGKGNMNKEDMRCEDNRMRGWNLLESGGTFLTSNHRYSFCTH